MFWKNWGGVSAWAGSEWALGNRRTPSNGNAINSRDVVISALKKKLYAKQRSCLQL
jgi:hypothetical protein